jgi:NAD(P)-dependent dehydrogenase (short-subunit alcohol dehydrogenase family)
MGNLLSSQEYNLEDHGKSDRALFDEYVADDSNKFQDLSSKVVAITGTSAQSIGFHIAEIAVRKKAKVLMLCNRDSKSSAEGTSDLKALAKDCGSPTIIETVTCDLQDLASVKAAAEKINSIASKHQGLDVLVCNAGVMGLKDVRTKDGFDVQMQTNQLSHFLLVQSVWKSIVEAAKNRGEARVVTHSSSARDTPGGNLEKDYFIKSEPGTLGGDGGFLLLQTLGKRGNWSRYHQSKLANANFAMALHDKIAASSSLNGKIQASSADPGLATSNLQVTTMKDGGLPS